MMKNVFSLFWFALALFVANPVAAQIPSDGLVGYWPFTGNANDASGNGYNGISQPGSNGSITFVTDRFGNSNSAIQFTSNPTWNSLGPYIEIPNSENLLVNSDFTMSYSIKVSAQNIIGEIINKGADAIANSYFSRVANGILQNSIPTSGIINVSNFPIGSWQTVTITYSNSLLSYYLNGVFQQSVASGPIQSSSSKYYFGSMVSGSTNGSYYPFQGIMDDISLYNRALSPAEITQIYTSQTSTVQAPCPTLATNLQTGLVGYWPFCGNANDESGNGNNGTVNGATLTTDRFGNANSAYSFDGVNDWIETLSNNISNDQGFTFSLWLKPESLAGNEDYLLQIGNDPGTRYFGFRVQGNGYPSRLACEFRAGGNYQFVSVSPNENAVIANNNYYMGSVTYDNQGNLKIYLNGQIVSETNLQTDLSGLNSLSGLGGAFDFTSNPIKIGAALPTGYWFDGDLDDIGIWNRALTPAEITQLYTDQTSLVEVPCTPFLGEDQTVCAGTSVTLSASGSPSACPTLPSNLQNGLVGYWPFCGNANDASGNGNNGTVNGATLTTDRFGNANSAYSFDGVSNYIEVPSSNALNLIGSFTLNSWIRINTSEFNSSTNGMILMSKNGGVTGQGTWHYGITRFSPNSFVPFYNADPCFCSEDNGSFPSEISSSQWMLLSCSFNTSSGFLKYFINGVEVFADNQFSYVNQLNSYPLRFGKENIGIQWPFHGELDDFSIYNRALTASEIQQLYTLGQSTYLWSTGDTTSTIDVTPTFTTTYWCTVTDANGNACTDSVTVFVPQIEATDLTICAGETTTLSVSGINSTTTPSACPTLPSNLQNGLVGYWPFCGNANDASGNGNNGTVNGATLTADRFGNANSAYSFNGDKIILGTFDDLNLNYYQGFTISFYTNDINPNGGALLSCYQNGDPQYSMFFVGYNNQSLIQIGGNGAADFPTIDYSLNNWHFVSLIFQNGESSVLIDGQFVGFVTFPFSNSNSNMPIIIGATNCPPGDTNCNFLIGDVDDVSIHNRALTAAEIQQLYTLGQTTYLWSNGATTPTLDVSPTTTTTYTCTVSTNGVSCTDSVTVVVNNPVIDLGADVTVCGSSTTLTAPSGFDSYLWSNGGTTNTTTFTANGTYSCTVTQGGCSATDSIDVTLIDATITASDTIICAGETVTLSVPQGGATSTACATLPANLQNGLVGYWPFCGNANDASGNGNTLNEYFVAYDTDRFGNPNASFFSNGLELGQGSSMTSSNPIFNIGQSEYTIGLWMKVQNTNQVTRCLFNTIPHTGIGIAYNDNNAPGYVVYDIGPADAFWTNLYLHGPTNNYQPNDWHYVVLKKQGINYSQYIDGSLDHAYTNPAASNYNYDVNFRLSGISPEYQIFHGNIDDVHIYNRALSEAEILQHYNLTAAEIAPITYLWSNGATTPTIDVSPTTTTTYTCTITTNGVSCTDSVTVVVSEPVASITPNGIVEICEGESIALTANGGGSYLWNTGAPTQSITVDTEGVYTVTVTDINGCTDSESQLVKVNFLPNIAVNNASICPGQSTTLTATGGINYVWSPATGLSSTTGTAVTASPSTSTLYTVTGTGANGCTNTAIAAVTVNALPTATITPATATTFCQGGSVVLNSNTGTGLSYQWFNNAVAISGATSASYTANASGSYTVVVTNASTCSSTSSATVVTVNALPTATITPATATTFCQGGSVVLNANTGTGLTYQWYNNASAISGATSASYTANASGSYTVVVTNASLCSTTSNAIEVTTVPNVDYFADADGDGFGDPATLVSTCIQPQGYVTNNTDCDDTNANINTAVNEICNDVDDNCNSSIDEGLTFTDYYADLDNDGFGTGAATNSCVDLGAGYALNNTDCDDTNANINTAANEICNDIDDNCNSSIDEGLTFTDYYADLDNDGFGAGAATSSCVDLGAGYVLDNTDCDDTNAVVNPAAEDLSGNGIDENCDGQIDNSIAELANAFIVYPNPASTNITLQVNSNLVGKEMMIYDAVGKIILVDRITSTSYNINTNELANGNYILRVESLNTLFTISK